MIAALPDAERAALLAQLGELVPDEVYRHPLRTELYCTRLRSERTGGRCRRVGRRVRLKEVVEEAPGLLADGVAEPSRALIEPICASAYLSASHSSTKPAAWPASCASTNSPLANASVPIFSARSRRSARCAS